MTCAELYQLMNYPESMSDKTLPELKQIVADFPYFHAARMLYLKNLAVLDDICLKVELKKMAIHIPDRMKLFMLLEGRQQVKGYKEQQVAYEKPIKKESKFNLVESFLSTSDTSETGNPSLIFEAPASGDYMQLLSDDDSGSEANVSKLKHQDLIDSFIENENEGLGKRMQLDLTATDNIGPDKESLTLEKDSLDTSYFTETLAHVYIKQKRYDKALEIIKNLSLKYPEKNIYFADQIRFLEKLIIHTKK